MKRKRLRKAGLVRRGWSGVVVLEFDTVRDRRCLATSKGGSPHWRRVYLQRIYAHEPPSRLRLLSGCVEKPSKRTEQSIIGDLFVLEDRIVIYCVSSPRMSGYMLEIELVATVETWLEPETRDKDKLF